VTAYRARRAILALAALVVLGALAGCGEKKESAAPPGGRSVDLLLDFFPNADHAGIYAAIAQGTFRRSGLAVRPQTPSDPAAPLKLLAAGRADLAISYEPEVLLARDRGLKVAAVGAIVQRPLTSVIALGSARIRSARDLAGKRVGTAGIPYQSAYLQTILRRAGLQPNSVDEVNVGFSLVPAMLSRKVDATLGGFWNYEGVQLALRHRHPTVIPVDRLGVPNYDELVVVAREETLRQDPTMVRAFMRALTAGYESARRNPRAAVSALTRANRSLDPRLQLASLRATIPAFFPRRSRPFGYQDQREWASYAAWMLRNRLIRQPANVARAATNEFLPGQGL
jgi:putative hydroxymethylpyrimidine transport system substrate-binding protein